MSSDRVDLNARVNIAPSVSPKRAAAQDQHAADPVATPAMTAKEVTRAGPATVEAVAQRLESYLRSVGRAIEFKVDDDSGRTVISVRDAETGELIRQIPNEEVLRLAEMAEDQTIVLLHETV